jgi:transposase InsO family protein
MPNDAAATASLPGKGRALLEVPALTRSCADTKDEAHLKTVLRCAVATCSLRAGPTWWIRCLAPVRFAHIPTSSAATGTDRGFLALHDPLTSPATKLRTKCTHLRPSETTLPGVRSVADCPAVTFRTCGASWDKHSYHSTPPGYPLNQFLSDNSADRSGYEPGPKRGPRTWSDFIRRHATTLWACDFFSKKVWTCLGLSEMFVFVVIHIGSRRVHVVGMTAHPDAAWMAEQADQLVQFFGQQLEKPRYLIRDLDGKFTTAFDARLEGEGMEIVRVGPRAPNLNAYCERWIGSLRRECLDHFIVFGEAHLRYLVEEYVEFHNTVRPHQGMGNKPLSWADTSERDESVPLDEVICDERLGGLLRHYCRAA